MNVRYEFLIALFKPDIIGSFAFTVIVIDKTSDCRTMFWFTVVIVGRVGSSKMVF